MSNQQNDLWFEHLQDNLSSAKHLAYEAMSEAEKRAYLQDKMDEYD